MVSNALISVSPVLTPVDADGLSVDEYARRNRSRARSPTATRLAPSMARFYD